MATFEEPSSDVIFYRRFGKRVYCSHMENASHCKETVVGQIKSGQYVYHYCQLHKLEQAERAERVNN